MASELDFSGRTVIATGAAVGFGRAIAEGFAARGARVYALDVDAGRLTPESFGHVGIRTVILNVTDRSAVAAWVEEFEAADGPAFVLVNNAGGALGRTFTPLEDVSDSDWDEVLGVNLTGAFNMARALVAGMKRAGEGRIINVSSGAGFRASRTGVQAYSSAKHGLHGLTRQLAQELGSHGITVNAVSPGLQPVSPGVRRQWESYGSERQARILDGIPLGRLGEPEDIANTAVFLASNLAGYITGQILPVNGGAY